MVTFESNLIMFTIGIALMIPHFFVLENERVHIAIRVITAIMLGIGFFMFCAYGTRALETFPSIAEIKELLR